MLYSLVSFVQGECREYREKLINDVADKFGLKMVKEQKIPPHFVIKYPFVSKNATKVEQLLSTWLENIKPASIKVGGINGIPPDLVFTNIEFEGGGLSKLSELVNE